MPKERISRFFIGLLVIALLAACGKAEQVEPQLAREPASQDSHRDFGDYRIHFNALSTDHLAPEVALAYGITRSQNRAMLNVSIIRREASGTGAPVNRQGKSVKRHQSDWPAQNHNLARNRGRLGQWRWNLLHRGSPGGRR